MNLVSPEFFCFFLAVFFLHWLLPARARVAWLVFASYIYYAWWDWRYTALLFSVTGASYLLGRAASPSRAAVERRAWVAAAVVLHVGLLAWFKLGARGADSLDALRNQNLTALILPLGLSYYTFQSLGYVLDVSRGARPAQGFLPYCLFVGFFAQITAGPIGRARDLLPQIEGPRAFDRARFQLGCHLIYWGLFQKVFVADNLNAVVASIFDASAADSSASALLGVYAFTLQLYADFAGYTNMARGMGMCLGFDLAENFRLPFFAQDVQEHWKRWHISLSEWFADFVYKPLVNLPLGYYKFFAAPLLTMLIMGLWHRFSLQMALLGLNYGFWIAVTIAVKLRTLDREPEAGGTWAAVRPWLNRFVTLHLVCAGFILLRARSLEQAGSLAAQILGSPRLTPQAGEMLGRMAFFAGPLVLAEIVEYRRGGAGSLSKLGPAARGLLYAGITLLLAEYGRFNTETFFYSRF